MSPSMHDERTEDAAGATVAPNGEERAAGPRRATVAQTLRAVAWSFFGIRRSSDHERDLADLNPVHLVVAGLAGAAVFVAGLVLLVRWVVSSGAALG